MQLADRYPRKEKDQRKTHRWDPASHCRPPSGPPMQVTVVLEENPRGCNCGPDPDRDDNCNGDSHPRYRYQQFLDRIRYHLRLSLCSLKFLTCDGSQQKSVAGQENRLSGEEPAESSVNQVPFAMLKIEALRVTDHSLVIDRESILVNPHSSPDVRNKQSVAPGDGGAS